MECYMGSLIYEKGTYSHFLMQILTVLKAFSYIFTLNRLFSAVAKQSCVDSVHTCIYVST